MLDDCKKGDLISVSGIPCTVTLLLNDISAHAFELVIEKLKERSFIK
jgi:hypothetical protein